MNDDLREELHSANLGETDQYCIEAYIERAREEDLTFIEILESEFGVTV